VIRRGLLAIGSIVVPVASFGFLVQRGAARLLDAPRTLPEEAALGPALDALGGEILRIRSRDGLRLTARWLEAEPGDDGWSVDPHEAILLLHGYSGSIAPDLVEYAPFLRRTAGVFGLDFRGHGGSDPAPTTFGLREVEDVAGALAWLGERGVRRVALHGSSMGAGTALAAVAVLGDGTLPGPEIEPDRPIGLALAPRPRVVAIVADSASSELPVPIAGRLRLPILRRQVADLLFAGAARRVGEDLRATEPIRIVGLVEPVPILFIHGEADTTTPVADAQQLAAAAGPSAELWTVPQAEHSGAHAAEPLAYERRVTAFLRRHFAGARDDVPIIGTQMAPAPKDGS
jgi:pimeloyl-ACP methyl ester carboxylesterase